VTENGQMLQQTFDAYNRVSSYTDVNGFTVQYRRDANGNVTNLIYPGNLTVKYAYDSNNRLTNVTDWSGRQTVIAYDLAGHLTGISRPNNTIRSLSYDNDGELTNIVEQTTTKFPISFYTISYNPAGRIQWEFKGPPPHTNTVPTRTMTYDNDNRLATFNSTSVTIDAAGNLTYGPGTNSTFGTYSYDSRNRLTSAQGVAYAYDPANNRTFITNGSAVSVFVTEPGNSEVLMRITGNVTNYYIYGPGLLYEIDVAPAGTTTAFYHFDCRGSTVALTDGNGNPTDLVEYSPYGTTTYRSGTNTTPFLFNGQLGVQTDPNGLLYMRARYYNPYISRFLNPDPSGFAGGLNYYVFADGNPISETDPFGLWTWGQVGSAALHFGEGVVVGAVVTAGVVLAAPEIAAGGAAALIWAGVTEATATTVATATVTGGLGVAGVWGASGVAGDIAGNASANNWNNVAYDVGTLAGGFAVGGAGGGRYVADNVSPSPSTVPPSWNPFTADEGYGFVRNSDVPLPTDIYNWLGTGPTPTSGGTSAALTAAGLNQVGQTSSWLSSSPGTSSSSTGK
jgi:RHS repeat-associated protein